MAIYVTELCMTRATGTDLSLLNKHCEGVRGGQNKVKVNKFNKESWGVHRDNLQDWWDHQGGAAQWEQWQQGRFRDNR